MTFIKCATAAILGISSIALATPASAQYYSPHTYSVRERANGFQLRNNNTGGFTNFTNRGDSGYNFNSSSGWGGQIRIRDDF